MKKCIAVMMVALFVLVAVAPSADAASQGKGRGGFMGFIAGCCFGVRAGSAYNEGKELHFREWCTIIPYVGVVFSIWNGIDCAQGKTTASLASQYGASYY